MNVFLDTNVLLDVLTERKGFYRDSFRVWTLAEQGKIRAMVSVISFSNIYYIAQKVAGRRTADRLLRMVRDTFAPVAFDEQILNQAIDAELRDFEDAIQFFTAQRAGADTIVTRNPRHFPTGDIPVQTPAEFLAAHFA